MKHRAALQPDVNTAVSIVRLYIFPASIAINGVFFFYSVIKTFLSDTHPLWFASLAFWYLLMAVSKIQLLYPSTDNADDAHALPVIRRTQLFLIVAGATISIVAVQVYCLDFEVGLSIPFVILNGSYTVMKLLFKVVTAHRTNRSQEQHNRSAFDVCRERLSIAEAMFAFSLIFYKLIAVYGWVDDMLSLMAMIYGVLAGITVMFAGVRHAKQ